jgi:hypothetical protein
MNVESKRRSDSEIFGARITEFGVVVGKIWGFEAWRGYFVDFSRARDPSGIIFQKLGIWLRNSGPRVGFPKVQGPFARSPK